MPGVHCMRMRQVPLVTCILLCYTKIVAKISLPSKRPHCRAMLPVIHIRADLKSEVTSLY